MAQSLAKIYLHIIFATKYRRKLIDKEVKDGLYRYIQGILKNMVCPAIIINGTADHVHILCLLSRNVSVSDLLEEIKRSSSKWIKTQGTKYHNFYWQNGYGAFSVSESLVDRVKRYVERQEEHHARKSLQEEYLALLEKYGVEYDERYLWE